MKCVCYVGGSSYCNISERHDVSQSGIIPIHCFSLPRRVRQKEIPRETKINRQSPARESKGIKCWMKRQRKITVLQRGEQMDQERENDEAAVATPSTTGFEFVEEDTESRV